MKCFGNCRPAGVEAMMAGMILAGVDEAGYGPLLGPLVVGCCAFEIDQKPAGELPCLWKRLGKVVGKSRDRKGRKLHVNDSKQVYSPSTGLKELERSILALTAAWEAPCEALEAFLERVSPGAWGQLVQYRWYQPFPGEPFPAESEAMSIRLLANGLRSEMEEKKAGCVYLGARVVPERQLNQMIEQTRNKSSVLFSTAAMHLDYLLRTFGERGLVIFCDRQGGREHYGRLLREMFEDWAMEVLAEGERGSEYRLLRKGHAVRILFREKAEEQCLPVAAASMLSKYVREMLMRRFNAWWRSQLPELEPTAGYYTDGVRFLRDIEQKRRELGIGDGELIRSR